MPPVFDEEEFFFRTMEAWPLAILPPVIPYCYCIARIALLFLVLETVPMLPCLDEALLDLKVG